jgi:hypothetical protein
VSIGLQTKIISMIKWIENTVVICSGWKILRFVIMIRSGGKVLILGRELDDDMCCIHILW